MTSGLPSAWSGRMWCSRSDSSSPRCVTWHVLLRKREVASAVGWIGLAWFAPITGAIIYFVFGVNRVQRRARRLRSRVERQGWRPVRLALARRTTTIWTRWSAAMGRITARPTLPDNAATDLSRRRRGLSAHAGGHCPARKTERRPVVLHLSTTMFGAASFVEAHWRQPRIAGSKCGC